MADEATASLSGGGGPANPGGAAAPLGGSAQPATTTDRPGYIPETFWDADKKTVKLEELAGKYGELSAAQQAEADRRATLPKAPADYAFTPPEGFKLPEGAEIDPKAPAWGKLQEIAHKEGLSPDQFSRIAAIGLDMQLETAAKQQQLRADYVKAEEAKLGDNAKARVEGVQRFIDQNFGDQAADMKAALGNAAIVAGLEKMISALQAGGITAFNGSGRDFGRGDGKPANWDAMTPVDRLTWTRTNAQQSNGASR